MEKLEFYKCETCGSVKVDILTDLEDCCNTDMIMMVPNTVDAAIEKHVPTYEKVEDEILVKVNHVMEKEHFIEWISLVKENKEIMIHLFPEQSPEVRFPYIPGSTIYAYCNKHGLWKSDVD